METKPTHEQAQLELQIYELHREAGSSRRYARVYKTDARQSHGGLTIEFVQE